MDWGVASWGLVGLVGLQGLGDSLGEGLGKGLAAGAMDRAIWTIAASACIGPTKALAGMRPDGRFVMGAGVEWG